MEGDTQMTSHVRKLVLLISFLFLYAGISPFFVKGQNVHQDEVLIVNTGTSSNNPYQITVSKSGHATFTKLPRPEHKIAVETTLMLDSPSEPESAQIPAALVVRFFLDLNSSFPLSKLPVERCDPQGSPGSATYISYGSQRTPDLSCSKNRNSRALYDDVIAITMLFVTKTGLIASDHSSGIRRITMADNEKTVQLHVGQTVRIALSSDYDWALEGYDQRIFNRLTDTSMPADSQGSYRVMSPGQMTLRAMGQPHCAPNQTSCGMALQYFTVTLDVQ